MAITRLVARVFSILLCLSGLTITPTAGLVVAYQLAKITPRIGMLVIEACLVCFLFTLAATTLAARLWPTDLRMFPLVCSAIVAGLFALALFLTVLRPMRYSHLALVSRANTQYWNLPTRSRIAYSVYEPPAGVPVKADPIVFVHGGPGVRAFDTTMPSTSSSHRMASGYIFSIRLSPAYRIDYPMQRTIRWNILSLTSKQSVSRLAPNGSF